MSIATLPRAALAATIGLCLAAFPPLAAAVQNPTSCDFVCTTDCELTSDIVCDNSSGIELAAGADLDLKGHKIICYNPGDVEGICANPGVTITAANSVIRDTGTSDPGHPHGGFSGPFAKAISCLGKSGSRVTGITIDGVDGSATVNCTQVDSNVFISRTQLDYVGNAAILFNTSALGTTIRNNYVANFGVGINVTGNKVATIDGNVVEAQEPLGGTGVTLTNPVAITVGFNTSSGTTVTNNQLLGPGGALLGNGTALFTNNRCDVTSADCQTCLTAGYCVGPAVPYLLDRSFVLRPVSNGTANQFNFNWPPIASTYRWVLLNDTPDDGYVFHSYIANNEPTVGARTSLFYVGDYDAIDSDLEFQSCVIEAHMAAPGPAPTYLVIKVHGVQSDGSAFVVDETYPTLYRRAMPTNPTTVGGKWTGADLNDGLLQIGVKNDQGSYGVEAGDLVMRCK